MNTLAFFVGLTAVAIFLLSYLQKKRKHIIALNVTSRILYILQYILLSAFEGAVLDIAGVIASLLAQKKNSPFIKKHLRAVFLCVDALIITAGLLVYKDLFSLLPIMGTLLATGAFWLDDEKLIRRVSFLGSPFWFVYNFVSGAYGSCIGDALSMVSILIAMVRYGDFKKSAVK